MYSAFVLLAREKCWANQCQAKTKPSDTKPKNGEETQNVMKESIGTANVYIILVKYWNINLKPYI